MKNKLHVYVKSERRTGGMKHFVVIDTGQYGTVLPVGIFKKPLAEAVAQYLESTLQDSYQEGLRDFEKFIREEIASKPKRKRTHNE